MIIPAPGFILIELLEKDEKTKQGVYLPQDMQASQEPMRAKVVEVGESRVTEYGKLLQSPDFGGEGTLHPDDIIYFKQHTAQELPGYDTNKLALIPFEVVIALDTGEEKT